MMPSDANIGYLFNQNNPNSAIDTPETEAAARRLGTMLLVLPARTNSEIDAAFDVMVQRRTQAVLVASDPFFLTCRDQPSKLTIQHSIAGSYAQREFVEAGGLVSYGTSLPAAYHQIGIYAARILAGAKPGDLPVVQHAKFDLVIDMKAARALGIEVSPTLLARADEVFE
jgi:putative ABC transport system substrate-binding protein